MSEEKKSSRHRNWVFTRNYKTEDPPSGPVIDFEPLNARYLTYQYERGEETGVVHIQGLVCFNNPRTFLGVQRVLPQGCYIDVMKGTFQQAKEYCQKAETRIEGPFEYGSPLEQGKRNDLETVKELLINEDASLDDIMIDFPKVYARYRNYCKDVYSYVLKKKAKDRYTNVKHKTVIVLWGKAGTGKTSSVYIQHGLESVYSLNIGDGSGGNSVWFDDYQGEPVLLIDDFYGQLRYSLLLRLLDIYPLRVQQKGSYTYINFDTIYITSNEHPNCWYETVPNTDALFRRFTRIEEMKSGANITP